MLNKIVPIAIAILLSSCSRVWVVSETQDGGTIGYRSGGIFTSDKSLSEKIRAAMKCPDSYEELADELRSEQYQYQTTKQVTTTGGGTVHGAYNSYNYNSHYTTSVPVTETGTTYWRELTYRCRQDNDPGRDMASMVPTLTDSQNGILSFNISSVDKSGAYVVNGHRFRPDKDCRFKAGEEITFAQGGEDGNCKSTDAVSSSNPEVRCKLKCL